MQQPLYAYIGGTTKALKGVLIASGGVDDHIHLLVRLPAILSIADLVRQIKCSSTNWVRTTYPQYNRFAWQEGYGAFSVSKSVKEQVITYIDNQKLHHKTLSFHDEFLFLLDKHGIEYDEKYLWK